MAKQAVIGLGTASAVLITLGLVFFFVQGNQPEYRVRYDKQCPGSSCDVMINVDEKMKGRIELRYELTKFYQNNRRYAISRVDTQLAGEYVNFDGMSIADPYRSHDDSSDPSDWILPCGLVALTAFNDSFTWNSDPVLFKETGIAFKAELDDLFRPLNEEYGSVGDQWLANSSVFSGAQDEHFITWMRTSFLPTVTKTYAICDGCTIEAGQYGVQIDDRYPTEGFGGEKWLILTVVTPLGTRSIYLGLLYLVSGGIIAVYTLVLLIASLVRPRAMGEPFP